MRKMSNANQKDYFALKYGREPGSGLTSFGEHKKIIEMGSKSQISAIREDLKQYATKVDLKQEVGRLELKISETRADLIKEIGNLNVDINKQIASLVKWVVGFGITIVLMFISLFLGK